jgi:hypothetical protein
MHQSLKPRQSSSSPIAKLCWATTAIFGFGINLARRMVVQLVDPLNEATVSKIPGEPDHSHCSSAMESSNVPFTMASVKHELVAGLSLEQ